MTMSAVAPPADGMSQYARYIPRELEYNSGFEDNLMRIVLNPSTSETGIRILHEHEQETPINGSSIRATDVTSASLPHVEDAELPLSLDDPRRVYASAVRGLRLTHPGGFLEGGSGLDPEEDAFAREFLLGNSIPASQEELQEMIQSQVNSNLELLRQRMSDRQKAIEHNEQVEKEIRNLVATHDLEMRMQRRMIDEQKAKKEARDKKRQERKEG